MGAAPLRPSIRPSQYSSTVLPRGLMVPIPVTTTRVPFLLMRGLLAVVRCAESPSQCLPNLTHEVRVHRLHGGADRVLDRDRIGATVRDDRHPVDAQEGRASELAPVHPGPDAADAGPDQQAAGLAAQRPGDLVTHGAEDQ